MEFILNMKAQDVTSTEKEGTISCAFSLTFQVANVIIFL